jgi:hypothetical protein
MQTDRSPWERLIYRKLLPTVAAVWAVTLGQATHPKHREGL